MDSAFRSQLLDHIRRGCVEANRGTKRFRKSQFLFGDVNRDDFCPQFPRDLHGDMTQAANAKDRQALARSYSGLLQRTMGGYTGTKERRRLNRRKSFGDFYGVAGRHFEKLREAAIHSYTCNLLFYAKVFVAFQAERALPAGP